MEIASTSPMWEPRRMLCTQNDHHAYSFTAGTDVSARKCFVQIQLRVHDQFSSLVSVFCTKESAWHDAILQDTHIGDVNAVMLLGFSVFIRVCANEIQCYWWRMSSVFDLYTSRITRTPFHDILLSYENTLIRSYYTWSIAWMRNSGADPGIKEGGVLLKECARSAPKNFEWPRPVFQNHAHFS